MREVRFLRLTLHHWSGVLPCSLSYPLFLFSDATRSHLEIAPPKRSNSLFGSVMVETRPQPCANANVKLALSSCESLISGQSC